MESKLRVRQTTVSGKFHMGDKAGSNILAYHIHYASFVTYTISFCYQRTVSLGLCSIYVISVKQTNIFYQYFFYIRAMESLQRQEQQKQEEEHWQGEKRNKSNR